MENTAEHQDAHAGADPPAASPEEAPPKAEGEEASHNSKELPQEPTEAERELEAEAEALESELSALENKIDEKRTLRAQLDDQDTKYKALLESHELNAERVDVAEAQRAELEFIVAKFGDLNLVEKRIDSIEETVAADSLQHVWNDTVAQDDIAAVNIPSLQVRSLRERATTSLTQHEANVHRANELMMKVEQEKSLADATLAEQQRNLTDAFEAEKKELLQTRAQLKALETEQQFHIRRGTYIKDPPPPQLRDVDLEKQVDLHNQMCAELVEERERLETLADDVRALRKDEDVERERANAQVAEMNERIKEAKSIAEEMEWEREVLLIEKEELAAVKKDLVAVTAAVKQQRKH